MKSVVLSLNLKEIKFLVFFDYSGVINSVNAKIFNMCKFDSIINAFEFKQKITLEISQIAVTFINFSNVV